MKIYLIQHAEAKTKEEDVKRGLSEIGIENISKISDYIKNNNIMNLEKIYCSNKKRAKQTAEILAKKLNLIDKIEEVKDLNPKSDIKIWVEKLNKMDNIALIGHLPHLNKLASFLISGDSERTMINFQNAAVLCLEESEEEYSWIIKWYLTKDLI